MHMSYVVVVVDDQGSGNGTGVGGGRAERVWRVRRSTHGRCGGGGIVPDVREAAESGARSGGLAEGPTRGLP